MKDKFVVVAVAAAALAAPAVASAGVGDKATGGGQILVSSDGKGAGTTIAFNGKQDASGVTGQVQIVDRAAGKGKNQVKFHGVVDCIEAVGNTAKIGGTKRGGGNRFQIFVTDNGEGSNADNDTIVFNYTSGDPTCAIDSNDDDGQVALARGNAQVRDGQASSARRGSSTRLALRLARL